FLRGEQYAVSLARIEHGVPTLGVLGCPNLSLDKKRPPNDPDPSGSLYFAVRTQGLWETALETDARNLVPVRIVRAPNPPEAELGCVVAPPGVHGRIISAIARLGLPR